MTATIYGFALSHANGKRAAYTGRESLEDRPERYIAALFPPAPVGQRNGGGPDHDQWKNVPKRLRTLWHKDFYSNGCVMVLPRVPRSTENAAAFALETLLGRGYSVGGLLALSIKSDIVQDAVTLHRLHDDVRNLCVVCGTRGHHAKDTHLCPEALGTLPDNRVCFRSQLLQRQVSALESQLANLLAQRAEEPCEGVGHAEEPENVAVSTSKRRRREKGPPTLSQQPGQPGPTQSQGSLDSRGTGGHAEQLLAAVSRIGDAVVEGRRAQVERMAAAEQRDPVMPTRAEWESHAGPRVAADTLRTLLEKYRVHEDFRQEVEARLGGVTIDLHELARHEIYDSYERWKKEMQQAATVSTSKQCASKKAHTWTRKIVCKQVEAARTLGKFTDAEVLHLERVRKGAVPQCMGMVALLSDLVTLYSA